MLKLHKLKTFTGCCRCEEVGTQTYSLYFKRPPDNKADAAPCEGLRTSSSLPSSQKHNTPPIKKKTTAETITRAS